MRPHHLGWTVFVCLVAGSLVGCGGSDPPEISTATAQWVLQLGGTLRLAGKVKDSKSPGEIPPPPYQIERINLNETKVQGADLQKLADLKSASRQQSLVTARGVAIHLARQLTDLSLEQIGAYLGGRDHTTVLNGLRRTEKLVQSDPAIRQAAGDLKRLLLTP